MKKKVIRLNENDIERLVRRILKEEGEFDWTSDSQDWPGQRPPIKRHVTNYEQMKKYCHGTKWSLCTRDGERYFNSYAPLDVFISGDDKVKIACTKEGDCWSQTDHPVSSKDAAEQLGVSSLDVIGEDGIITEGEGAIHTKKWDRCVQHVKDQGKSEESAYKICSSSVKNAGVKSTHQRKKGKQYVANRKG